MLPDIIEKWENNKGSLRKWFNTKTSYDVDEYKKIVEAIAHIILDYDEPKITEIDNGSYQGCSLFVIVDEGDTYYSPEEYLITYNYYGSCSGCDTLLHIIGYGDDPLSEEQVDDLMTLSLHIIQRMFRLSDEKYKL